MSVFDDTWDVVINLGIKCNTLSLSVRGGVRYFSSPFDNIDTVEGLRESADLLSERFEGYFQNIEKWHIKNHLDRETNEVHTKILWHENSPNVFYPHFNERWLSGDGITPEQLTVWKESHELDLETIFPELSKLFNTRQQRLVRLLETGLNVLFLRVDERRNVERRIVPTNSQYDFEYFVGKISAAFPSSNIKCLYFYCQGDNLRREFSDTDKLCFKEIPNLDSREEEDSYVISHLQNLK